MKSSSIRIKLFILQAGTVVSVAVIFTVVLAWFLRDGMLEDERAALALMGRIAAEDTDHFLEEWAYRFEKLANNEVVQVYTRKYQTPLLYKHFKGYEQEFSSIAFVNASGREELALAGGRVSDTMSDWNGTRLFAAAREAPGRVVTELALKAGGRPFLLFAYANINFFDEFLGVVIAEAPLEKVLANVASYAVGKAGFIMLARNDGTVLLRPEKAGLDRLNGSSGTEAIAQALAQGKPAFARAGIAGQDSHVHVEPVPGRDWTLLLVRPREELMAALGSSLARSAAVALAFMALVALLAFRFSARLTRPLLGLSRATEAVAHGDFSRKVAVESDDELGQLAASFNAMSGELETYRDRLVKAKEYTESILQSVRDLLLVVGRDGTIKLANRAVADILGLDAREVAGRPLASLFPTGHDNGQALEAISRLLGDEGAASLTTEAVLVARDGRLVPVILSASTLACPEGCSGEIVCVAKDFTERKRMEEELLSAKENAEAADRAKDMFLANMSHELRTPLTGILGYTQVLKEMVGDEVDPEILDRLERAGWSLQDILSGILDLAALEKGGLSLVSEEFDLRQVIESSIGIYTIEAGAKGVAVEVLVDPAVPSRLVGDPVRLRQVLLNLVGNGVKFTDRGRVELRVRVAGPQGQNQEVGLLFEVEDTGCGIPSESREQIFTMFAQGDDSLTKRHAGVGLGLTLSKALVEMMHGSLWFESEDGRGTTFRFTACFKEAARLSDAMATGA